MAFLSCLPCIKRPLEEVTDLDLRHKTLDDVPNDIFNYERTLETLNLDSNNIRDLPRPLFHCHGLRHLGLADNEIGMIPSAISSLNQLVSLDVSRNILTDIPESIKQCKHLEILDASVNPMQRLPEGCTQLVSLAELYLNDVFLEYLPANFGRLAKLRILELRENGLTSLPKSMSRLVNLTRVDLGQNQFSEVPEVLCSMVLLEELWLDGNRLLSIPSFIGNLVNLKHLDLSVNQLTSLAEEIGCCTKLQDLTLSTNDLQVLPETLGNLSQLVTLKVEDNQLETLPECLGKMGSLEEIFAAENYITLLPRTIGWLRNLHTLILDENDLQELPPEIGSCRNIKILSLYANRLTGIPQELGHITKLAVLNLAGNRIPHLPLSFVKLKQISAIWLTENQTKPLVQLNPDTDPYSGEKVLTNFLLPQQVENDRDVDTQSESGSFHAAVWEEERSKRSLVKWAGEEQDLDKTGNLRRAPTPFPKEMRAMAKKVQNLRDKKKAESPTAAAIRKKEKEFKPRPNSRRTERRKPVGQDGYGETDHHHKASENGVMIKSAKVTKAPLVTGSSGGGGGVTASSVGHQLLGREESGGQPPGNRIQDGVRVSPDKISRDSGVVSPSDAGSLVTDGSDSNEFFVKTGTKMSEHQHHQPVVKSQEQNNVGGRSVVLPPPVKAELITNELDDSNLDAPKPPPYHIAAAKSKFIGDFVQKSSAAVYTEEQHFYENQDGINNRRREKPTSLERKSSFLSDATFESISESETSTAPSSLQTIVRAPYASSTNPQYSGISEYYSSSSESSTSPTETKMTEVKEKVITNLDNFETSSQATTDSELVFSSASKLRKVSEQLLSGSRTRGSVSAVANSSSSNSRPGSIAAASGSPRDSVKLVQGGPGSIGQSSSSGSSDSRPASRLSIPVSRPSSQLGLVVKQGGKISTPSSASSEVQNNSYISPANTVGLPQISNVHNNNNNNNNNNSLKQAHNQSSKSFNSSVHSASSLQGAASPSPAVFNSKIPRLNMFSSPTSSDGYPETGGLLSTISQAALSDDESPPSTHVPSQPKFNTASLARTTASQGKSVQPNYENLETAKQQLPASTGADKWSYPGGGGGVDKWLQQQQVPSTADKVKSSLPRKLDLVASTTVSGGMTQGQYRAAASQATVSTIPEEPSAGAYLPMNSRKGSMIPLATSSPSGVHGVSQHNGTNNT